RLESEFGIKLLIEAGLVRSREDKQYDYFRNRIMFPLRDVAGRVVGFSGRLIGGGDGAKYLNSPDTPVFEKGSILYGLYEAKNSLRKLDFALLVEGQIDLVMCHQIGPTTAVASSGTAFTQSHLEKIKRYTNNLLLAFDSDKAGMEAAVKVGRLAYREGMVIKVITLPDGND